MSLETFVLTISAVALGVYAGRKPKTALLYLLVVAAIGLIATVLLQEIDQYGIERLLPWGAFGLFILFHEPVSNYLETHKSSKLNILLKGTAVVVILALILLIIIIILGGMVVGLIK